MRIIGVKLSIWSEHGAKRPNNERALGSLGNAWSKIPGRLDDAIAWYEKALRLNPNLAETRINLGNALKDGGPDHGGNRPIRSGAAPAARSGVAHQ